MKKLYFFLFLTVFVATFAQAQDTLTVTFRITFKGSGRKISSDGARITGMLGATNKSNAVAIKDWDPPTAPVLKLLTPTSDSIYGATFVIARPANDTLEYKFINGLTWGDGTDASQNYTQDERGVTAPCIKAGGGFGNRILVTKGLTGSVVSKAYIFNTCSQVFASSTTELSTAQKLSVYPNPVFDKAVLSFENIGHATHSLDILNITGQIIQSYPSTAETEISITTAGLAKGLYFARLRNSLGENSAVKFIVQ